MRKTHLVGIPIGEEIHAEGEQERDDHARLPTEQITDRDKKPGEERHQNGSTKEIHGPPQISPGTFSIPADG